MTKTETDFHEKAKNIIIQFSLFRWENGVLLAGTILLTAFYPKPFTWWPVWGWPVLGLLSVAGIFFTSLTNHKRNARLILQSFQEKFELSAIGLPNLKADVQQALEYQKRINEYLLQQNDSPLWDRANDTTLQIQRWIEHVFQLAQQLDRYQSDRLLKKEMADLPKEIAGLTNQSKQEKDPVLAREFDQLLQSKLKYQQTLTDLDKKMKQAALQLENSLSSLATVDSQIRLIGAQDVDRVSSDRLRTDIQDQIDRLSDLLASIKEVYEAR